MDYTREIDIRVTSNSRALHRTYYIPDPVLNPNIKNNKQTNSNICIGSLQSTHEIGSIIPPFADEDPEAQRLGNLPTVTVESVVKDKLWGPVLSGKGE